MAALQGMGAYLRTLKSFQVEVATTDEDVLDDGQKIQYAGTTSILARMPNGLRAEVANDRRERMYLYDGKTFTLFAKRLNFYATVPAPPTVGQLADTLDEKYDVTVPIVDLFRWGTPGWSTDDIKGAMDVGPSTVEGVTCQQYAFRQDDIDWQIWIQKGDHPLPAPARDHDEDRRGAAAAHGRVHVEPRAFVQRRGVRVRPAGGRRQGRSRQGRRGRGRKVGGST